MPIQEMLAIKNSGNQEAKLALLMAIQCAPLIRNRVVANVLTIKRKDAEGIIEILRGTGIVFYILRTKGDKVILFLYRRKELKKYLESEEVSFFLAEYGYEEKCIEDMLKHLSCRIAFYSDSHTTFPHEIGIFLGYPLADVRSFIENDGKNSSYTGYWKVYHNVQETIKLFNSFDEERELAVREIIKGKSIWEIAMV